MKKCILSAIGGAVAMLASLIIIANISVGKEQEKEAYEHIDFVSTITQDDCFICGEKTIRRLLPIGARIMLPFSI